MLEWTNPKSGATDGWRPHVRKLARKHPQQPITNYVNVESVTQFAAKVEKLVGKVMKPKTAVPHVGYFAICQGTENNEVALWEKNDNAK